MKIKVISGKVMEFQSNEYVPRCKYAHDLEEKEVDFMYEGSLSISNLRCDLSKLVTVATKRIYRYGCHNS